MLRATRKKSCVGGTRIANQTLSDLGGGLPRDRWAMSIAPLTASGDYSANHNRDIVPILHKETVFRWGMFRRILPNSWEEWGGILH